METRTVHLDSLLTDGLFDIPIYQRSYSWTEPQLTDLFEDLLYLPEEKSHFFGNIILRKQDTQFETDRRRAQPKY
ncbi:MAG: GmrSD restriction endonuclease domain-containing protein [Methanobacteriota archaeon]